MFQPVPDVPVCSGGGGNTNSPPPPKINPAIRWSFTFNNYTDDDYNKICSICSKICKFCIIAKETGESGTPHLQGYFEFKVKSRPTSKFSFTNKIHFEKSKGSKQDNIDYCSKDDNEPFIYPPIKKLNRLACEDEMFPWQTELCNIFEGEPDLRKIYWYWSSKGGTGKTTFARYLHRKYGFICLGGKSADMKNAIIEYKKTNDTTPEGIVVNIPKSFNEDYISYTGLEEVKDMFFYSGKYEGGMVDGNQPHLIVFANVEPDFEKMTDRFIVKRIDNDDYDFMNDSDDF